MKLFKWLRRQVAGRKSIDQSNATLSLYADLNRVTGLRKFRARSGESKGWFGVDKAIHQLPQLSEQARNIYVYLSKTANKNGYCFPFQRTIARKCSIPESEVTKALEELQNNGLLIKVARRVNRRGGSSNIYQLRKIGTANVKEQNGSVRENRDQD